MTELIQGATDSHSRGTGSGAGVAGKTRRRRSGTATADGKNNRKTLRDLQGAPAAAVRLGFFLASVLIGFCFLELPWNDDALAIPWHYLLPNLLVLALGCGIIFLIGQRTRASLAVFAGLCLFAGVANFFLIEFKGQPIVPADLFALGTAASVAGGYSLFLTPRLVACLVAFAAFCVALRFLCPKRTITRWDVLVNCTGVILLVAAGAMQYGETTIKDRYDVKVDVWDVRGSYGTQGTALCFLSRAQELTPKPPEGYSPEAVDTLLAPFSPHPDDALASPDASVRQNDPGAGGDAPAKETPACHGPNVIAIMNETFSDLSTYPGLEDTAAAPPFFHELAAESLVAGDVYVSAMGGGTCNSEFEFLTGASMGNMGGGVYPYVLYDLEGVDNLASYFRNLGYGTHAIHPAEGSNWRRDRIYEQLGFDEFDDITTMEDADMFRDMVTDRATYERALEKIDEEEGPQFVFDVTIQNHGGYETGLVPASDRVHVESEAVDSPEVDEFVSSIHRSDEDLRWLVDELNARNEPTVIVFFGDHQPGFADWLFGRTYGHAVEGSSLAEVQQRYRTPYLIWANEAAQTQYGTKLKKIENAEVTSLNYLRTLLVEALSLPETPQESYRAALRQVLPAVNLNGYRDAEGEWHWFGEAVETDAQEKAADALEDYRIVQYDQLFGDSPCG